MCSGPSSKLFVGGLSWSTDENSLREAFSSFGEVIEAKVVMDRETGRSRGFGFVSFTSVADAESALQSMDGRAIGGRSVRVNFAIEKPPASRGFGGGFGFGGDSTFNEGSNDQNDTFNSSSFSFGKDSFGSDTFGQESVGGDSNEKDSDLKDEFDSSEGFAQSR